MLARDPTASLQVQVVNFYWLSDPRTVYLSAQLTADQLLGKADSPPITFRLNISRLYDATDVAGNRTNYFTGGRMYIEATLSVSGGQIMHEQVNGHQPRTYHKQFLDFREFAPRAGGLTADALVPLWAVLGVVGGLYVFRFFFVYAFVFCDLNLFLMN